MDGIENFGQKIWIFANAHRWDIGILGIVLILGGIFYRMCKCARRKIFVVSGEWGTVSVSMRAIRGAIRGICDSISPSGSPRIRIREKKSTVSICIRLRAPFGSNVLGLSQKIQESVAHSLREQFGFSEITSIDVVIEQFRPPNRSRESFASIPPHSECPTIADVRSPDDKVN
jgi:uncharacterized alkaline shock family protein YloU